MAKRKTYPVQVTGDLDSTFAVIYTEDIACPLRDCKHIVVPSGTLTEQRKYKKSIRINLEGCTRALLIGTAVSKVVLDKRFSEMDRAHGGLFLLNNGVVAVPTYDAKNPHQTTFRKKDIERWRSLEYSLPLYEEVETVPNIPHRAVVFLDIETTCLEPAEGEITSLQLLWEGETAYYIACPSQEMLDTLYHNLVEAEATVVAHNALFDCLWLSEKTGYNWFLGQFSIEDTMLFAHNRGCSPSNLKHLTSYYTSENNPEAYQQEVGSFDKTYAVADVVATKAVYERLVRKGKKPIDELSTRLLRVFGTIRYLGIALDRERLEEASELGQERLTELEEQLSEIADINWSSPKQVLEILQTLGLNVSKTDVKTLEQNVGEHPAVQLLLDYRKEEQMAKLFYTKYRGQNKDGKVFPTFLMGGTETGRTSCTSPNIQQANTIAKQMFVSRYDGGSIYRFDLDRNELCCAVFLSGDKKLAQALVEYDFHSYVASLVYEIPYDQVTKEQRKISKIATFGAMMYGGSPAGIAHRTGTDEGLIKKAVTALRGAFKDVVRFQDEQVRLGQSRLRLVDCYGKIRDLQLVKHYGYGDGSGNVRRVSMNTPVQALGGYICLELCSLIFEEMLRGGLESMLIGQVHDSIYIDVKPGEEESVVSIIKGAFLALNEIDTLNVLPGWGLVPVSGQLARGETMSDIGTEEVCSLSSWLASQK